MRRILLVSHELSRTGAPLLLLDYAKWLAANTSIEMRFVSLHGGPLEPEFRALGKVDRIDKMTAASHPRLAFVSQAWAAHRAQRAVRALAAEIQRWKPDAVHANTVVSGDALELLGPFTCPVICHVHEMRNVFALKRFASGVRNSLRHADRFIACSRRVKDDMSSALEVPPARIDVSHSFAPASDDMDAATSDHATALRRALGCQPDTKLVAAVGLACARKGSDLFVPIAKRYFSLHPDEPTQFVWIGKMDAATRDLMLDDIERAGLAGKVVLTGEIPHAGTYFPLFSAFVLPSREDPFPLVMLEAGRAAVPVIGFRESGGVAEYAEYGGAILAPFLDVCAFAEQLGMVLHDEALHHQVGLSGKNSIAHHFSAEILLPRLWRTFEQAVKRSAKTANLIPSENGIPLME